MQLAKLNLQSISLDSYPSLGSVQQQLRPQPYPRHVGDTVRILILVDVIVVVIVVIVVSSPEAHCLELPSSSDYTSRTMT